MVSGIAPAAVVATLMLRVVGVDGQEAPQRPPPNLHAGAYQQVVMEMWRDSPSFRRQCLALATAPDLTVRIRGESRPSPTGVRARGEISINPGGVSLADILLMSPADTVELIGAPAERRHERVDDPHARSRLHECAHQVGADEAEAARHDTGRAGPSREWPALREHGAAQYRTGAHARQALHEA